MLSDISIDNDLSCLVPGAPDGSELEPLVIPDADPAAGDLEPVLDMLPTTNDDDEEVEETDGRNRKRKHGPKSTKGFSMKVSIDFVFCFHNIYIYINRNI